MQLGMFIQPVHPPERDYPQVLDEDREAIIAADKLGFAECWIGEHHTATIEPVPSPLMLAASLLDATEQIRFGTAVTCLPQYHPMHVASYASMFDNLSKGRFNLGIGAGSLTSDVEVFEIGDPAARAEMVQESIDMILQIWEGEAPYDLAGKYWKVQLHDLSRIEWGVGRVPKPFQKPHPPIAITVVSPHSSTALLAGRRGWLPISANFIQARFVATHLPKFLEGQEAAGQKPDPTPWRVARSILVTDTDAEAEDALADPEGALGFYFGYLMSSYKKRGKLDLLKPEASMADGDLDQVTAARSMSSVGSPKTVLDKLIAFRDVTGPFGTLLSVAHDWDEPARWRRSMHLLAQEVMPRFVQHCKATDPRVS